MAGFPSVWRGQAGSPLGRPRLSPYDGRRNTQKRKERLITMRTMWVALLVLCGAIWTGPGAEARSRTEQAQAPAAQSVRAASTRADLRAARAAAAPSARRSTAPGREATNRALRTRPAMARSASPRREAATRNTRSRHGASRSATARREAARSGQVQRAAAGVARPRDTAQRAGTARRSSACRGRGCGSGPRPVSWQSGLMPATNVQAQACPVGTLATLARGHTNIVRCLPL